MLNKIRHLVSRESPHRQLTILSAVIGLCIIAFTFNRLVFNRSTIIIHITQPDVTINVDGEKAALKDLGDNRYAVTVLPGKHTITITADGAINHKEVVEAKAGRSQEITPALTIAPDAHSDVIGPIAFTTYDANFTGGPALFYLGNNGHSLMQYMINGGAKLALSDPVFNNITQLSWAYDHSSVIVRNLRNNWFYFDFRKRDFVNSEFQLISDPSNLDIQFDPTALRVGFVGYHDGVLVFGVANPRLEEKNVLTKLDKLHSPHIVWSPTGTLVALQDDASFDQHNVTLYDLAANTLRTVDSATGIENISFSPDGGKMLLAKADGSAYMYTIATNELTSFATLTQPKSVNWIDANTVIALIQSNDTPELVTIQVDTHAVSPYGATPSIDGDVVGFYANTTEKVLYFVSNSILYTFPLLPAE